MPTFNLHLWLVIEVPKKTSTANSSPATTQAPKRRTGRQSKTSKRAKTSSTPVFEPQQVYIIEPAVVQLYRTTNLHERIHYQIDGWSAVVAKVNELEADGFKRVQPKEVDNTSGKVVTILKCVSNHFLQELTVINDFSESPAAADTIPRLQMEEWAKHFANMQNAASSASFDSVRGIDKYDVGFTTLNCRDRSVQASMNAPSYTTAPDAMAGLEDGETVTQSIMTSALALQDLKTKVSNRYILNWDDDFRLDSRRHELFAYRSAAKRGFHGTGMCARRSLIFEGMTVGMTGEKADGTVSMLGKHVDQSNALHEGYNVYYGFAMHQNVTYPEKSGPVTIRVSLGCYGKKAVEDFLYRLSVNERIVEEVKQWRNNNPDLFVMPTYLLRFNDSAYDHRHIRPRVDKSSYFSIFIEGLLKLGEKTAYDLGALLEAVYLTGICISPIQWYRTLFLALDERGTRNLFEVFTEKRVIRDGSVSKGRGRRRQPSHGDSISMTNLYQSLANMYDLTLRSEEFTNSEVFVKAWAAAPGEGGVFLAGVLTAQEHIYLLSALGIISHYPHGTNARIAPGTETHRRLVANGVRESEGHMVEIVRYTAEALGVLPYVAENLFCEMYRDLNNSNCDAKDTIVAGQGFYTIDEGSLLKMDDTGKYSVVPKHKWGFNRIPYDSGCRWWESGFDARSLPGTVHFTKSSKEKAEGEAGKEEENKPSRRLRKTGLDDAGETTEVGESRMYEVTVVVDGKRSFDRLEADLCALHFENN